MAALGGVLLGCALWLLVRFVLMGLYTVDQNERAVKTVFGRAQRVDGGKTTLDDAIAERLRPEERERYCYPQVRVIPPGGPYFRMPWEKVHKVSIATSTVNMARDVEDPAANSAGTLLEAVTKDQLNTGLTGQIRFRVSESNLYAYLFGIKQPIVHVMAYFVSVLRQKIASFEAKPIVPMAADGTAVTGVPVADIIRISINDLRKNLRDLNDYMDQECIATAARYGVVFDASLITGIDPPPDVESALAAINTAHNQVSSDISLAQAGADQKIVQSKRAVEIETLRAQAEVEPLRMMAEQLADLKTQGPNVLRAYVRNVKLALYGKAQSIYLGKGESAGQEARP
jgi:regulator of protease activity HflC (stomatin/prohibitin superfamily)